MEVVSLKCVNHKERVTEITCGSCKKPICRECRVEREARFYCTKCLEEVLKRPQRDTLLEGKVRFVGAFHMIWGAIFLVWGIFVLSGWNPPLKYQWLGAYEGVVFTLFGVFAFLAGMGTYSLTSWGRWGEILLSLLVLGGVFLLHPLILVAALFHLYFLVVLGAPKTGEIYKKEYQALISEEELKREIQGLWHAVKVPAFILFGLTGCFLALVAFVIVLALEPVYFAPVEVRVYHKEKAISFDKIQAGQELHFSFLYEHKGVHPGELRYQFFIDQYLWSEGKFLPPPEEKAEFFVPIRWRASPGNHTIKVFLSLPFQEEQQSQVVQYEVSFSVPKSSR